jgi:hypothetical protein
VALRHQLNVLRRKSRKRLAFSNFDRLIFANLYRIAPNVLNALVIVKPETVIGWHRAGFRLFWRWKSRCRGGRPKVSLEIRQLIRAMSLANPLWGAPRIHGELLKLGIDVGQTSVAKYMARHRRPPSQGWKTFLRNHADGMPQWISSSFQPSRFGCFTACSFYATAAVKSYGWGDGTPERRMDGPTTHGSVRLGMDAEVHRPRSRFCLWQDFHPAASCHGHSRPANCTPVAMAEWPYGTADSLDPAGMS